MSDGDSTLIFTPEEVADFLRVDAAAVRALIEAGELPAFKVGAAWRIVSQHLVDFVRRQLDTQHLAALEHAMRDPRRLARELDRDPELRRQIDGGDFGAGTVGAFLQRGLKAIEAEADAGNVVELRPSTEPGDS